MDWNDIGNRAMKTAVQTFLGLATVQIVMNGDLTALQGAATAAAAAGLSVIWNALAQWASSE